ncbi:MAG: glucose-1-phosphate thymidylyltransferase [Armatimonadetes bacterium]|nr:glucose-1-phosphate thymidylyltransferase [Armatimonadota bacterium]
MASDLGLAAESFFDLAGWDHAGLFVADEPVWTALGRLGTYLAELTADAAAPEVPEGVFISGSVLLGEGVVIEPGAYIKGPAVIEAGAELRQGCYVRGNVLVGAGAVVGHCSELKNVVLLPGAKVPHFNYVGDSLIGRDVNLGAGTICSNVTLSRGPVMVSTSDGPLNSGLRKFGAVLGDRSQTGCNVVLNPGTVAGRGCRFYPMANVVGCYAAGSTVVAPMARPAGRRGSEGSAP